MEQWVIDVRHLVGTRIHNFICKLVGPAKREAIDLLADIQFAAWQASFGLTAVGIQRLLNAKPVRGQKGVFEKKGKYVRVYFKYEPGRRLVILDGGPKTTQKQDIQRLGRKV